MSIIRHSVDHRTFGCEIECMLASGVTREQVAAAIRLAGLSARSEGYGHGAAPHWRVITDASLGYDHGAEIVSPILRGEAGLADVRTVMRTLTALRCTVNVKCGFHVHIGADGLKPKHLKRIAKCFIRDEAFFDLIVPPSRRRNDNMFVQSNRARFGGYDEAASNRALDAIDACADNVTSLIRTLQMSRFYKLNFFPLQTYGTIEYRHGSGTVDADKAEYWIRLLLTFTDLAAQAACRKRSEAPLTDCGELSRFFVFYGIDADTRAFFRARMRHFKAQARRTNRRAA